MSRTPDQVRGRLLSTNSGCGQLEGLDAVWLQAKGAPDASDARRREAAVTGHAADVPMRGFPRLALQRLHDDALDLGIGDLARHAWPRLIKQPVNAARDKAPAPLANRLHTHPLACRHRFIAQARGAAQHDPRPRRQGLRRRASLRVAFQKARNLSRQFNPSDRTTRSHPHPRTTQNPSRQIITRISGSRDTRKGVQKLGATSFANGSRRGDGHDDADRPAEGYYDATSRQPARREDSDGTLHSGYR